ncbi:hypothetical protein HMPREF0322_00473 [Desulfitobacterium hafniense DP7]|uniref:Uncharacterized protein n=1 Tax=Desulfitobacterium hafniense DP7 TaxID=537010 RepID=G9XHP7_DESHA|nr:hypothetical protein HMPREF0322_00473 [Desulfitobacterium hafniense DP7]
MKVNDHKKLKMGTGTVIQIKLNHGTCLLFLCPLFLPSLFQ